MSLNPANWIEKHGNYLYNYAISRTHSTQIAEDLVQDTFLSALKAKGSFKGKSSEKTWLIAILKRKIIDYYRQNTRNIDSNYSDNPVPFKTSGRYTGHWIENQAPQEWNIENSIENKELLEIIRYCLSQLPPKWSSCFSLKNLEELSNKEICKELAVSESNLWVMLHRARLQLRKCIEINWFKK